MWMTLYTTIVVALPLLGIAVLYLSGRPGLAALTFLGSVLLHLGQVGYRHSLRVYLIVQRISLQFSGRGASWGARAEFECATSNAELIRQIADLVRETDPRGRVLARETLSHVLAAHDMTITVKARSNMSVDVLADSADPHGLVVIEFLEVSRPFREALVLATERVPSLLEQIRKVLEPTAEKYSAELTFKAQNPYFGFFLRNLAPSAVDRFTIELHVDLPGERLPARVTAQKELIRIVAPSVSSLSAVSKRYLTLSRAA